MADATLRVLLMGKDVSASKSIKGVGDTAGRTGGKLGKLGSGAKIAGAAIAGALVTAGAAAIQFGADSLKAYADAEKSQKQLEDAYKRFPKLANVNIESLRQLNKELQRKTGADDDSIASGQAVLAQFDLTGKQIQRMTPLLVDYATKTGKDMPTAAKTLGKAMLGNARALKDLGIDFKSTGNRGKDFSSIMTALTEKVGGYAESIPEAELKSKVLAASFGDLQEMIGERLQPVMIRLTDEGQKMLDYLDQNPEVMEGVIAVVDLLIASFEGLWEMFKLGAPVIALLNEYGIRPFIKGLGALFDALASIPGNPFPWAADAAEKIHKVDTAIGDVNDALSHLNDTKPILSVTDKATPAARKAVQAIDGVHDKRVKITAGFYPDTSRDEVKTVGTGGGGMRMRFLARGGRLRAGEPAVVGENGWEVFMPDSAGRIMNQSQLAAASGGALGGVVSQTINVHVDARGAQNPARVGRETAKALAAGQRSLRGRTYQFKAQTA